MSYTPGPWSVTKGQFLNATKVVAKNNSFAIAQTEWGHYAVDDTSTCEANARLIAAAPELVAMLEALIEDVTDEDHRQNGWSEQVVMRNARALLARIKGE